YENPIAGEDRLVSMALGGVNGDWRLFVSDDLSNGEGGSIASWSLEFEAGTILHADYRSESVIPITTEQLTATGKSVDLHLTFAPSRGCDLTLVNQTGPNFIEGEFDNLPNGANVDLWYDGKVYHFVAWYFGGDGNDLKLLWRDAGLASWGRNVFGELGNGGSPIWYEVPVAVDQKGFLRGKTIAAVSAGSRHTLVLCTDGTLAAWGENQYGQIGDGTYLNRFTPVPVDQSGVLSGKEVFAISAGEYHNLVICSDGTLATWGANFSDQLGDPRHPFGGTTVPVEVNRDGTLSGRTVISITNGGLHNLVLCSDGTAISWGDNSSAQLGLGTYFNTPNPSVIPPVGALSGKQIKSLFAGSNYSMALCFDGSIVGWGRDSEGQLGAGTSVFLPKSVLVDRSGILNGKMPVFATSGERHTLVLLSEGSLAGWGLNRHGELGDGTTTNRFTPIRPGAGSFLDSKLVTEIAAGASHSLALCSDGTLASWGWNYAGMLGDGTTTPRLRPVAIENNGLLADKRILGLADLSSGTDISIARFAGLPSYSVEGPDDTPLTQTDSTVDFGSTAVSGASIERRLIIRNQGLGSLSNLVASIENSLGNAFSISVAPDQVVGPGESTLVAIRFSPDQSGPHSAVVRLSCDEGSA
ncbi:MAG: hypothetical protein KDM63_16930, partial [Verrucomicrobiae bacterium]|nr:hypothetical protein [Verrucomicrobiae bacterium]